MKTTELATITPISEVFAAGAPHTKTLVPEVVTAELVKRLDFTSGSGPSWHSFQEAAAAPGTVINLFQYVDNRQVLIDNLWIGGQYEPPQDQPADRAEKQPEPRGSSEQTIQLGGASVYSVIQADEMRNPNIRRYIARTLLQAA